MTSNPSGTSDEAPEVPNAFAIAGSTGPVVTTLLAGITLSALTTGFDDKIARLPVSLWPLQSTVVALIASMGLGSLLAFLLATVYLVRGQASDVSGWSKEQLEHLLKDAATIPETDAFAPEQERVFRLYYRERVGSAIESAEGWVWLGVVLMLLSLGVLIGTQAAYLGILILAAATVLAAVMTYFRKLSFWGVVPATFGLWLGASKLLDL